MEDILNKILELNLIETLITIVISLVFYQVVKKIIIKGTEGKGYKKLDNRKRTYVKLIINILKYAFVIITILIILQINGINVTSMLAGVGIAGAIIGLALQDALKDIIMGANILTDDFFAIGDVVKYNEIEGKVISFGLKSTKIQDIMTGNVLAITNRNIEKIEKVSNNIFISIPAPYEVKMEKIDKIATIIVEKTKEIDKVIDCEYLGLTNFEDSSLTYKLWVKCKPENKYVVNRKVIQIIKKELDKNGVEIPFMQIDIHNKG